MCRLVLFASCFGYHLSNIFLRGVVLPDLPVMCGSNFVTSFYCVAVRLVPFASCFGYHLSNNFLRGVVIRDLPVMRVSNFFEQYLVVGTRFRGPQCKSYDLRSFSAILDFDTESWNKLAQRFFFTDHRVLWALICDSPLLESLRVMRIAFVRILSILGLQNNIGHCKKDRRATENEKWGDMCIWALGQLCRSPQFPLFR